MKKTLLLLLFIMSAQLINAQSFGGSLILGLPQKEFKENVNNSAFGGIEGFFTFSTPGKFNPVTIGVAASYNIYGMESRQVPLSLTVSDVFVDVDRQNSMANFHLLCQISPFSGPIKPYIEGLAGGAYIFTETSVKGINNDRDFASSVNMDDFAWSYGYGGGLLISLMGGSDDLPGGLYLDIKSRIMSGSEAEYLTTGDLQINNGRLIYNTRKSKVDYISIQVGVVAVF